MCVGQIQLNYKPRPGKVSQHAKFSSDKRRPSQIDHKRQTPAFPSYDNEKYQNMLASKCQTASNYQMFTPHVFTLLHMAALGNPAGMSLGSMTAGGQTPQFYVFLHKNPPQRKISA
jgi:hypothetical protein